MKRASSVKRKAPRGFTISVGRIDTDYWILKIVGNTVQGRLLGRYGMRVKYRAFYQIELSRDAYVIIGGSKMIAKAGTVVNVDEIAKLEDLASRCRDGNLYDVWFQYLDKKSHGGSKTPWTLDGPYLKGIPF